jgi:hypothetical protein
LLALGVLVALLGGEGVADFASLVIVEMGLNEIVAAMIFVVLLA